MSDSGKDSPIQPVDDTFKPELLAADVAQVVRQQLVNLKWAGVTELPKSSGQCQFPRLAFKNTRSQSASKVAEQIASKADFGSGKSRPQRANRVPTQEKKDTAHSPVSTKTSSGADSFFPPADGYSRLMPVDERQGCLDVIQAEVADCSLCTELASTRTQTVFGVGSVQPRLVFLGEAPGADEDRVGEPFVGAAGKLLTKIIEAMNLAREDVYILNTLKCRPPGNRNPQETELKNCCRFAVRQLEILQPEFICCLGSIAAKTLLDTKQSIGRMRGQIYRWRGSRVVVTYHPAYLLRTPSAKKQVWADMQLIMAEWN